ncbi:hypothetical protein Hanom_Chr01g00012001 [Helianthus anomalus]
MEEEESVEVADVEDNFGKEINEKIGTCTGDAAGPVIESSELVRTSVGDEQFRSSIDLCNLGNNNSFLNHAEGDDPDPKETAAQTSFGGSQDKSGRGGLCNNYVYFFNSAEATGRPNKRNCRIRPRLKSSSRPWCFEPIFR